MRTQRQANTGDGGERALKARAQRALVQARQEIDELEDRAVERLRDATQRSRGYARENPWLVFGALGLAAGVLAGWLLRRRSRQPVE